MLHYDQLKPPGASFPRTLMASLSGYIRASITELRKVTWPTQRTVVVHTALVIVVSLVLMGILALFDIGLNAAFTRLFLFLTTPA